MRRDTLASFLKRIGTLDLQTFPGRLVLQKRVYFLQAFGFYLGYRYSWYLYGPYSPDLTRDAFALKGFFGSARPVAFETDVLERHFDTYLEFLGNHREDAEWLELTASIHFLKRLYPGWPEQKLRKAIREKQPYFRDEGKITEAITRLREYNLT